MSTNEVGRENPAMILQNILRLMSPERMPGIALTLSKFDMLQRLADVDQVGSGDIQGQAVDWQAAMSNYGASFRSESNPPNEPFDWADRNSMHFEIRSMLSASAGNVRRAEQPGESTRRMARASKRRRNPGGFRKPRRAMKTRMAGHTASGMTTHTARRTANRSGAANAGRREQTRRRIRSRVW